MPFARIDDTLEMYYEDDAFTDPWRRPETVVLHHGNAKNARLWYAWVPLLARQYRVVRLEARGFGRSTVPPEGYDWTLADILNPLAASGLTLRRILESPTKDSKFWQKFSYLAGTDDSLLDWNENPQAALPVWLALAMQKHA